MAYWQEVIRARFGEREDLGVEVLYARYWAAEGLSKLEVLECLNLIETEYELPAGILRADDSLDLLFDSISTRNPFKWWSAQPPIEDRASEINYQLGMRLKDHGTLGTWTNIKTIDDLIHAWCGKTQSEARNS
ncbi:MAG TPA: hypothetical protein VM095_11565 [Pyrinomonadaceae bacterium]|nr:hypothetical protein [Pyrinomonadaceae bacterium]